MMLLFYRSKKAKRAAPSFPSGVVSEPVARYEKTVRFRSICTCLCENSMSRPSSKYSARYNVKIPHDEESLCTGTHLGFTSFGHFEIFFIMKSLQKSCSSAHEHTKLLKRIERNVCLLHTLGRGKELLRAYIDCC